MSTKLPSDIPKFEGHPREDPSNHVMAFHLWCSSKKRILYSIQITLFQHTLAGVATKWYINEPSGTHTTFELIAKDLLNVVKLLVCHFHYYKFWPNDCHSYSPLHYRQRCGHHHAIVGRTSHPQGTTFRPHLCPIQYKIFTMSSQDFLGIMWTSDLKSNITSLILYPSTTAYSFHSLPVLLLFLWILWDGLSIRWAEIRPSSSITTSVNHFKEWHNLLVSYSSSNI